MISAASASGKKADVVLLDFRRAHLTPAFNPVGTLVHTGQGRDVATVIVDGRVVVENGRATLVDEEASPRRRRGREGAVDAGDRATSGRTRALACSLPGPYRSRLKIGSGRNLATRTNFLNALDNFATCLKSEIERWAPIVKASGASLE